MSELGQLLKQARLDKSITLEDLQETTKIRKRYLECIEEGNYKALPGNFYVRAFIKSYAEAVGLDPNEVLHLYQNVIPSTQSDASAESIAPKRTLSKRTDKWSRWVTGVMVLSFFLLIIGLIYYFAYSNYNGDDRRVTEDQARHLTDKKASDVPAATVDPQQAEPSKQEAKAVSETVQPDVKFVSSDKGVDLYQVVRAAKLQVQVTLTGDDCWMQIDKLVKNGEAQVKDMIEQGSLKQMGNKLWEIDGSAYLNLGRANAVELKVNGVIVPVGDLPNPKRFQFDLVKS